MSLSKRMENELAVAMRLATEADGEAVAALMDGGPGLEIVSSFNEAHGTSFIVAHGAGAGMARHNDEGAQIIVHELNSIAGTTIG